MGRSLCQLLVTSLLTVLCVRLVYSQGEVVNTTSGIVTGQTITFRGKRLREFKMVPYAEPRTGDLRFTPSETKSRETDGIDGTVSDYRVCPQPTQYQTQLERVVVGLVQENFTVTEDCLYLDVYVPQAQSPAKLLPVLFWIHGGAYVSGAGRLSSGRVLASDFDVVVVTINYRLGALGFLNTGDDNAVGDLGLRDQVLALQWVNQNIGQFGGDPHQITIAGESAGGASVAQLTVSPLTEGLFQRAIVQSGGLDNPWACLPNPRQNTLNLASTMNCTFSSNKELVDCLRSKSWQDLVKYQGTWAPACNGGIIPFSQLQLDTAQINSDVAKRLAKIDILIGVNAQEGGLIFEAFSSQSLDEEGGISETFAEQSMTGTYAAGGLSSNLIASLSPATKFLYTDWTMPDSALARSKKLTDFLADSFFVSSTSKYVTLHSTIEVAEADRGRSYLYLFQPRPSWMSSAPWRNGADHGDDLFFVFGNPLEYPSLAATDEERVLSQTVMTYWTNFIKTGNPNTPTNTVNSSQIVHWPPFDLQNQTYLHLDTTMDSSSVGRRMYSKRVAFWTKYFPRELARLQALKPPPPCEKGTSGSRAVVQATAFTSSLSALVVFWLHIKILY